MAVKFQPVKIPQAGLSNIPVVNGQLIYCYDTGRVFVDTQVGRLQQGISTVSDSASLPAIASDKLYFIKKSNKLVSFVDNAWKEVNSQQGKYLQLSGGTMTGGINFTSSGDLVKVNDTAVISKPERATTATIAGDHVSYSGDLAKQGIAFKGQVKDADVPSAGLVFYVPLAQQKETAQAGQKLTYNGTITHQTYKGIPCAHFSTAYISSQLDTVTPTYPMTVSIWAAPDTTQGRALWAFSGDLPMMYYNGKYHVYSPDVEVAAGNVGQWHHIVWSINADRSSTYYFDGVAKGTVTASSTSTFKNIAIGYRNGYQPQWKGYLAGFRVYNRALSAQEVQALTNEYNRGMQEVGFLMQFTDSKYSFKPTSDKYDTSDSDNFWTGKAVKNYVDNNMPSMDGYLPLTGGDITGNTSFTVRPTLNTKQPSVAAGKQFTTATDVGALINQKTADYLPLAGGTMTGNITLSNTNMDLAAVDTVNIAVTGKAVTDYVTKKTANYLPLSGGTVTGDLTVNGTTKFARRPIITGSVDVETNTQLITLQDANNRYLKLTGGTVTGKTTFTKNVDFTAAPTTADTRQLEDLDDTQLVTAKAIKDYGSSQYFSVNGGTIKKDVYVNGTVYNRPSSGSMTEYSASPYWGYCMLWPGNRAQYHRVGSYFREHSDSQTITKYGRGVQLVPGFFDTMTRAGLYLANYSSKASVSQIRKGIQIINTGTLYHSQDSTDGWDGFVGDAVINFTNKQNTNSIVQWGPVKDLIYAQKRFLYTDCGAGDKQISSDDIIYWVEPTNTTTKYTLPTSPDNPNYTHVRRLYIRLYAGYSFSIQGPVTWYTVPDFAPGYIYRLVFEWDRATRKWLGNMFWPAEAIS